MSLRPMRTVHRRGDWRVRLPFWDRETFQPFTVAEAEQAGDAVVSFAVFRRDDGCDHRGWLHDYGWGRHGGHRRDRPVLNVFTDDGSGYLRVADDRSSGLISIPQAIVAALPGGQYLASLAIAYGDGSVIDLGADLVTVEGPTTPTIWHKPQVAGGLQDAGNRAGVADFFPFSIPILPGAAGAWAVSSIVRNRLDPTPDFPAVVIPPAYLPIGPLPAGGYQPAGSDAAVDSIIDFTASGT